MDRLLRFKATDDQLRDIAALAVNASCPMGLGYLHFQRREYSAADFARDIEGYNGERSMHLDYVDGRMVKLSIREVGPGTWETWAAASPDYQSWCSRYPTAEALLRAAGITDIQREG